MSTAPRVAVRRRRQADRECMPFAWERHASPAACNVVARIRAEAREVIVRHGMRRATVLLREQWTRDRAEVRRGAHPVAIYARPRQLVAAAPPRTERPRADRAHRTGRRASRPARRSPPPASNDDDGAAATTSPRRAAA